MEFQKDELNEILNIFQQESAEIISSMDSKLLTLESDNKNKELIMLLFRDAHSLKGSARMLGYNDIQNIAHKIEDVISLAKEDKLLITPNIADAISESLEFILDLINKTVEQKEEYKSPQVDSFIKKLENIALDPEFRLVKEKIALEESEETFLSCFDKIEEYIIDVLSIVSFARQNNDYNNIYTIKQKTDELVSSIGNIRGNSEIDSVKNSINNINNSIDAFCNSSNQQFSFLELNKNITTFIEQISNWADSKNIQRKDYYEVVDKKISDLKENSVSIDFSDSSDFILQKLPLMELNCDFYPEVIETVDSAITSADSASAKKLYSIIKEIVETFNSKKLALSHDISQGIADALSTLKFKDEPSIVEAIDKIDVIKTLAKFQYSEVPKKTKQAHVETSQKDILNSITNTEIKTLRVDSIKLDNLVGQIGELIVSKIKTNEQLSLAKKINNDLHEWQKNFAKMSYYIKYFDKKYLSQNEEFVDYRKISAYNKQLSTLADSHSEKISSLIKEMDNLFRQIQESETKLNSTTNEIETMVKNMRILPLSTIFQLFPRMVHNIARDKNKKIDLIIEGADITADKTIIEEIKIPLMHIIRNSIDHGIEDIETRKALGKSPVGRIEIIANYVDAKVIIDVKDDGRGLDIEKIKAKALEKKLLTKDEIDAISDDELTNLIFYPGFSTENFVTELSGRGLGLDIVNNKINQLQGRIDIFSRLNRGTVVRIVLPATVATKKVFIIEEQDQLWAIETSVIKTIVRINSDEIFEKDSNNYYIYNGEAIAVYTLSQVLNFENVPRETNKYTLMIIETDNNAVGIIVEKLVSDQEIVHKKLAPPLYKVKNISGITTLANGEACLILNVSDIISTINSTKIGTKIITKNGIVKTRDNFKYKILIVDDSHTTRILQKNILSNYGYNVSTATNPIKALEKLKQNKFDLVISDVQMPEMNGFEFIAQMRKMPVYEQTPVIVVSSEQKEEYLKEIDEVRIVKYIQKNLFKQDELIEVIEGILNY